MGLLFIILVLGMSIYIVFKEFWIKHYIASGMKLDQKKFDSDRQAWTKIDDVLSDIIGGDIRGDDPEFDKKLTLRSIRDILPAYVTDDDFEAFKMDLCPYFDELQEFIEAGSLTTEQFTHGAGTLSLYAFPLILDKVAYHHEKVWRTPMSKRFKWLDRLNEIYEDDLIDAIRFHY
jgi:hypothetical protein